MACRFHGDGQDPYSENAALQIQNTEERVRQRAQEERDRQLAEALEVKTEAKTEVKVQATPAASSSSSSKKVTYIQESQIRAQREKEQAHYWATIKPTS